MELDFSLRYLIVFSLSILITAVSVPSIKNFGIKYNLTDNPDNRKQHHKPIVRLGGISIWLGILFGYLSIYFMKWLDISTSGYVLTIFICSTGLFLLGLLDDIFNISPYPRLTVQIIFAIFAWSKGISISYLDFSFIAKDAIITIPNSISLFLTIFWIVAIINSYNWLDGLDGLAAGTAIISSLGFVGILLSIYPSSFILFVLSFIGSCLGFLFFNFYKAKIHMGDSGSYVIGFNIAILSVLTCYSNVLFPEVEFHSLRTIFPLIILFLPVLDMSLVIFSRLCEGKSPFFGDRRHFHYKLIDLGLNQKESVLFNYILNLVFVAIPFLILFPQFKLHILCLFLSIAFFLLLSVDRFKIKFNLKK